MTAYLRLARPLNLIIVMLTQWLVHVIITQTISPVGITPVLNGILFPLFLMCTICLAAGANVINDILDIKVDQINRNKNVVDKLITKTAAWIFYAVLSIIGFIISIYIGLEINRPLLILIYPVVLGTLYLYSSKFKGIPLLGNIIVALFCAFVPGMIWFGEWVAIQQLLPQQVLFHEQLIYILSGFTIFSFMANLVRELVKDIEDFNGDHQMGIQTFPVAYGIPRAKIFAMFNMMITLLLVVMWWYMGKPEEGSSRIHMLSLLPLVFPPLIVMNHLRKIPNPLSIKLASYWLKVYMVFGILIIFILA